MPPKYFYNRNEAWCWLDKKHENGALGKQRAAFLGKKNAKSEKKAAEEEAEK